MKKVIINDNSICEYLKFKRKESKDAKTQRAASPSKSSDGEAALCVFAPLLPLRFSYLRNS